jgi:hypothetical protein
MIFGHKKIAIPALFLLFVLQISCTKKQEETVILLTPYQLVLADVHPAEVVSLVIDCQSPNDLKQLTVTSRIEGSLSHTILDTMITGKRFYKKFEYVIPDLIESNQIILDFTLFDILGNVATNVKIIEVTVTATYLKETSGHELYSGSSGKQNAYNILDGIPLYMRLDDVGKMHVADTSNSPVLLRKWISPAGLKFVKFNGFDYANCTSVSTRNSYNAGVKTDFIDNLTIGDIFLTKINSTGANETYIAIKIVNIIDNTGSEWDRYIFNLKK